MGTSAPQFPIYDLPPNLIWGPPSPHLRKEVRLNLVAARARRRPKLSGNWGLKSQPCRQLNRSTHVTLHYWIAMIRQLSVAKVHFGLTSCRKLIPLERLDVGSSLICRKAHLPMSRLILSCASLLSLRSASFSRRHLYVARSDSVAAAIVSVPEGSNAILAWSTCSGCSSCNHYMTF